MRSILLHVEDDDCLEARLQVALDLARAFDGHLTCMKSIQWEMGAVVDFYGLMAAQIIEATREQADALHQRLEARLAKEDVAWNWIQSDGFASQQLLRRSGLSDIIVLGSCDPLKNEGPSKLVGEIVLRSQTPVLVVPPGVTRFDCSGPALVAWDGSPEASRALRGALPLLAKAGSVSLVTVVGEEEAGRFDLPPVQGAEYLSRHGIACELIDLPYRAKSIAKAVLAASVDHEASYLVMGAYGRSRLSETIWGGVSREIFSNPPLPIFACH